MNIKYLKTKSAISTFYWEYVIILNFCTSKIASNYMKEKNGKIHYHNRRVHSQLLS